jgi:hypothetical protein
MIQVYIKSQREEVIQHYQGWWAVPSLRGFLQPFTIIVGGFNGGLQLVRI